MGGRRLTLNNTFREHLDQARQRGLKLQTLAMLTGFSDPMNLLSQMRVPFAPTSHNRERWRTIALLTNYDGEPLEQESSS